MLTHRIAYLLAERGVRPGEVLAITFTNKAAGEMRERVASLVGPAASSMWVSTFHSACVKILRREASKVGLRSGFTIYDAADSQRLMAQVCREADLDPKRYPPRAFSAQVSNLKNELVDEDSYAAGVTEGTHVERTLAEVYQAYQRRLRQAHAMDFDDLIMTTVNILQAFPEVAEHYRRRFRHVLVDEYQDTNHAQYVLVRELVGGSLSATIRAAERAERGEAAVRRCGRAETGRRRAADLASGGAGRADRGRRRRPVDLRLPRGDDPQHPRVRGRLPERDDDPARAELPLDPDDPVGGQRGDRAQPRPQAETALDGGR